MPKISYNALMNKLDEGRATVNAWADELDTVLVDVTMYAGRDYTPNRRTMEVTGCPPCH